MENPPIRVRLEVGLEKIQFEGLGVQIHGREKNIQLVAIPQRQNIEISQSLMQGHPVWRVVRNGQTEIFTDPVLALKAIDLRSRGKALPNQVFLSPQKSNKFDLIGVLPLENYLVGVLASEMPLSWPMETLKAQAIAARSYALVTMKERAHQTYHVESNILDQVFSHIGSGPDDSPLVMKAKQAVQETTGVVLLDPKQVVLKAFYHSDCGGRTASSKSVWGFGTLKGGAVDESCPSNPKAHWNLDVATQDLSGKLKNLFKKPELGWVQSLQLIRPSRDERVEKVQIAWDSGARSNLSSQEFRALLGYDQMRSTMFEVQRVGDQFQFKGTGFGHGVGLCQWGARAMGKLGKSYNEILAHYYPGARLDNFEFRTEPRLEAQIR